MSGQSSFPDFDEKPDQWGQTWNPKGEAGPGSGSFDSLPGAEAWADLARAKTDDTEAKMDAVYRGYIPDSPRWHVNRQPALERATNAHGEKHCERCRRKCDALTVHHLTYERFTHERPGDLLALCLTCHDKADEERRAAWCRQLARWREEAHEAHDLARFNGWLRKVKRIEPGEVGANLDWLRELRDEYEKWVPPDREEYDDCE